MVKSVDSHRDALHVRLRRVKDDVERLSELERTADIEAAIAALIAELADLEADIARLATFKEARRLRYRGLSFDEIAARLGISKTAIHRLCSDIPVDNRRSGKARLQPPAWLETARAMSAAGKNRHFIAKELGVPLANFYRAFNRFLND